MNSDDRNRRSSNKGSLRDKDKENLIAKANDGSLMEQDRCNLRAEANDGSLKERDRYKLSAETEIKMDEYADTQINTSEYPIESNEVQALISSEITKLNSITGSKINSRNGDYNNIIHSKIGDALMEKHDFVNIDDNLYYYVPSFGYWRFIGPMSNNNNPYIRLRKLVPNTLRRYVTTRIIEEVYGYISTEAEYINSQFLRERKSYINLRDCAVNINTLEPEYERKDMYFMFYLDAAYNQCFNKKSEDYIYTSFIKSLFGSDEDTIKSFECMLGLVISNIRNLKLSFILYGKSDTGKTTVLEILSGLFPKDLVSAVPFSKLDKEFTVSMLNGAVLNTSEGIIAPNIECINNYNSTTGNSTIVASKKGKDPFNLKCQAIFVTSCNSLPKISASYMEALLNRVVIFPFNNAFSREERNLNIVDEILYNKEILIKAGIEGIKRLIKHNFSIKESLSMQICIQEFLGENNSFLLFAKNYIRPSAYECISSTRLYQVYEKFCNIHDYPVISRKACAQIMKEYYGAMPDHITSGKEIENGSIKYNSRGFKGVELYNVEELFIDEECFSEEDIINNEDYNESNFYEDDDDDEIESIVLYDKDEDEDDDDDYNY